MKDCKKCKKYVKIIEQLIKVGYEKNKCFDEMNDLAEDAIKLIR